MIWGELGGSVKLAFLVSIVAILARLCNCLDPVPFFLKVKFTGSDSRFYLVFCADLVLRSGCHENNPYSREEYG